MESLNSDKKEIRTDYQDLQTYTNSVKEDHIEYMEHNTLHICFAKITLDSDSITQHNKRNGREKDCWEDHNIPLDKNEANNSMVSS